MAETAPVFRGFGWLGFVEVGRVGKVYCGKCQPQEGAVIVGLPVSAWSLEVIKMLSIKY